MISGDKRRTQRPRSLPTRLTRKPPLLSAPTTSPVAARNPTRPATGSELMGLGGRVFGPRHQTGVAKADDLDAGRPHPLRPPERNHAPTVGDRTAARIAQGTP